MSDFEEIKRPGGGRWNADGNKNLISQDDYRYSLNITRYADENYGVITNMKGSEKVSFTLPAGTNKVVGERYDLEDRVIYYLLYNSNSDHCILRYNYDTDNIEFILEDESILNFQSIPMLIVDIIGSGDEKMLFWTGDQINAPRKLNIARATATTTTTTSTTTTSTTTTSTTTT